ncbi:MAG: hypothetical protein JNN07_08315 [Verrucomicrobiales bacterium]|jgi:hypothetical protein|nr:hypothetical protein [Verrucomicrobiales bacterium]
MIQNVLRDIGGIAGYGVISICLFFLVFSSALIWAFSLKKSLLKSMEILPLEGNAAESDNVRKGDSSHE